MSDSTENTNELDNYGVWIKRPPQDAEESSVDVTETDAGFDETNPLGAENEVSLSDFDIPDFENTGSEEPSSEPEASEENKDEEISLDDFIDGDFTDPNPGATSPAPEAVEEKADGEISLDDFMDSGFTDPNPGSSSDSGEVSLDDFLDGGFSDSNDKKQDDVSDDDPLDIDLQFSDSSDNEVPTEEIVEENDSEQETSSEHFDDMFDSIQSDDGNEEKTSDSPSGEALQTEEISLDDFGIDENSDDATAVAAGNMVNESAEESVDLSDFGIDSDADETPVTSNVKEAAKNKTVDYNLSITEDDKVPEASENNEPVSETTEEPVGEVSKPETTSPTSSTQTSVDNSLLQQIISDLSGLKNEIKSLKTDFETLKSKDTIDIPSTEEMPQIEETVSDESSIVMPEASEEMASGFFGDNDDDDTIALSGDELNNIMNTADFSTEETVENQADAENIPSEIDTTSDNDILQDSIQEESVSFDETPTENESEEASIEEPEVSTNGENITENETFASEEEPEIASEINEPIIEEKLPEDNLNDEPDSGLSIDFENEQLEEPNLDDFDSSSTLPEEISIPKVDNIANENSEDSILVESSSSDFMDSVKDTTQDMASSSEESLTAEELNNVLVDVDDSTAVEEAPVLEDDTPISEEETEVAEADSEVETPEVSAADNDLIPSTLDIDEILPEEKSESDITEDSVNYLNEDSTPVMDDEMSIQEENIGQASESTETSASAIPSPVTYESNSDNGDLPSDIKSDVKSVLLYMDQLLENLPEDKIVEFAKSEQFTTYKKLFSELGLS